MNFTEYKDLVALLNEKSSAYYNGEPETMSDAEWDKNFQKLKDYEKANPEAVLLISPTQTVGAPIEKSGKKVVHEIPLKSLEKSKDFEVIKKFMRGRYCILLPKYDGNTCRLKYRDGELYEASSRGSGTEGEDITRHAMCFKNIPFKIPFTKGEYWVDGEAIITATDFEEIKKLYPDYKNPRNLTSGFLNRSKPTFNTISFFPFRVVKGMLTENLSSELDLLQSNGFNTNFKFLTESNTTAEYTEEYIDMIKNELGIGCDGAVFAVDNFEEAATMGETSHHPNHSMAFKFKDDETTSVVRSIQWQVGTSGELTPVAIFDPVELEGTTVTNSSVHNLKIFKELDFGIGDTVTVFKANQIIPQIKEALTHGGDKSIPTICPSCGSELILENNGRDELQRIVCQNYDCPAQFQALCERFVRKDYMNIDGLSGSGIKELINAGLIKELIDILRLEELKVRRVDYFKGKRGIMLMDSLRKAKENTKQDAFLAAWGIPTIGRSTSKQLIDVCSGDILEFIEKMNSGHSFTYLDGFGDTMQISLENWWKKNSRQFIAAASLCTFTVVHPVAVSSTSLKVVITGTLEFGSRSEFSAKLTEAGFTVQDGVKKDTNLLICGDKVGKGKTDKAAKMGIRVITEAEFRKEFNV